MIDLELLKTYAIDLLTQKTENGIGLETLGEYTKAITSFIAFMDDKYIFREKDLKRYVMDYFASCVDKCSDNVEKLGKITEIITVYIGYITETLEKEGECEA